MGRNLVIVYGPPFSGTNSVAWALARSFPEKTAVLSADNRIAGAIAVPDADAGAELDMAHTQLRLLLANYLKNGYNTVVEGAFLFERDGGLLSYEAEIDQLVALMRHLATSSVVVRLTAPEAVLRRRAAAAGRAEAAVSGRLTAAYKDRYGVLSYTFDTETAAENTILETVRAALRDAGRQAVE